MPWRCCKEVYQLATPQEPIRQPDSTLLVDYARQTGSVKRLVEILGAQEIWVALSPEKREELRRLVSSDKSNAEPNPT